MESSGKPAVGRPGDFAVVCGFAPLIWEGRIVKVFNTRRAIALAAVIGASAMFSASGAKASVITAWNFDNDTVAVNNSPAPSVGVGTASSIGMNLYPTPSVGVTTDDVVLGKSSDTGANAVADTTNTWRVRGQLGSPSTANGWSSAAPIGTQGAQFAASTVGYSGPINVSFDWYTTSQGEANLQLEYTNDGTDFINVPITLSGSDTGLSVLTNSTSSSTVAGSYVSDNLLTNGSKAGQDWFTGLTATINDPLAANDPNFAIELVNASTGTDDVSTQGTALNNSSGNWRFDNVVISGTAVPEPACLATLALAGLGLTGRRRSRR